jgi:hypothetical protein
MGFPKGEPRAAGAGRKKGVPNKATAEIKALARKHGPEAIKEIVKLAKNAKTAEAVRLAAWGVVLDRAYGKARQVVSGDDDGGAPITAIHRVIIDPAGNRDG